MTTSTELLPIGEAARRLGIATSALRYYESRSLVQPADFLLRERLSLRDVDAVSFVDSVEVGEDVFDVDLQVRGAMTRVRVRCRDDGNEPRGLTCSAVERHDSWSWEIDSVAELVA